MIHSHIQPPLLSSNPSLNPINASNSSMAHQSNGSSTLVPVHLNYPHGTGSLSQPHLGQMGQPSHPTQITYPQKVNPSFQPRFSGQHLVPQQTIIQPRKFPESGAQMGENAQQPISIVGSSN